MNLAAIERLVAKGESEKVELKKSTGQLGRAGQALCAFLNDNGGTVVIGITDSGKVVGQEVSDKTRREVAAMFAHFEPPAPLAARFPEGEIFREDRLPVPADALREVLLNAVMHRDYSTPSGYVAVAVFDDRIEVRSIGALPRGVTADDLSGPHKSIPRNPLVAEAFHRTCAVEIWGRGTNRVADMCRCALRRPQARRAALAVGTRGVQGRSPPGDGGLALLGCDGV